MLFHDVLLRGVTLFLVQYVGGVFNGTLISAKGKWMKVKKMMLCSAMLVVVGLLSSCANKSVTSSSRPSHFSGINGQAISTKEIALQGDMGEEFRVFFNNSGECDKILISYSEGNKENVSFSCKDDNYSSKLSKTYFCVPEKIAGDHKVNAVVNLDDGEKVRLYCGNIRFLTEGTDVQAKSDSVPKNIKCKNIGGRIYCY